MLSAFNLFHIRVGQEEVLYTLIATLSLLVALRLFGMLFRRIRFNLLEKEIARFPSLSYKSHTFIQPQDIKRLLDMLLRVVRFGVYLGLVYIYVSVVFSFFPYTRTFANILWHNFFNGVRHAAAVAGHYLPNLLSIILISLASLYFLKLVKSFFDSLHAGRVTINGFYREWAKPTYNLIRFFTAIFVLVAIFPLLPGFDSPAFKGISVFLGVLISLGSGSAVANAVAGIVLIYTRTFRINDRIETNGVVGDVIEKTLFVTRIRTIKNVEVTIPNSTVLNTLTQNFSAEARTQGLILNTTISIGYDAPWPVVHRLLINAAKKTDRLQQSPEPFILQKSLDDFYVSYELNAYTAEANQMANIYSDLHQNIQDEFNAAGIEIMSPHYRAIRDGNASTIPSEYPTG